ncbi:acyl carrier protein [Trichocoleus desertorum AS-A10]|uniref:acyl carrier protein n=1 Tax=Trichocoleus desertorum TaxID=1481672 RepID=UPI0032994D72
MQTSISDSTQVPNHPTDGSQTSPTAEVIQGWIIDYVAQVLEIEPNQVNTQAAFDQYGLDSATAISLICHIEALSGRELSPTLLYDLPSIKVLSQRLAANFSSVVHK